jgi:diguanylate cyclase (GGDEF)-like protein
MGKKHKNRKVKSLNYIVRATLISIGIIPLIIYISLNSLFLAENCTKMENINIEQKVDQLNSILIFNNTQLKKIAADNGAWNEAYRSVKEKDLNWLKNNFTDWLPQNYNLDIVIVANNQLEIVDKYGVDDLGASQMLENQIFKKIINNKFSQNEDNIPIGFIECNSDLYLIGISPIIQDYYKGSSEGVLIIGKKISGEFLDDIYINFGFNTFLYFDGKVVSRQDGNEDINKYIELSNKNKSENIFRSQDGNIIEKCPIIDINNNEIGSLFLIQSRETFTSTFKIIMGNGIFIFLIVSLITFVLSKKLRRRIINPIINFQKQISQIVDKGKLEPINIQGPEEINNVVDVFNELIANLLNQKKENTRLRKLYLKDSKTNLYKDEHFFECFQNKLREKSENMIILFGKIDNFDLYGETVDEARLNRIVKNVANIMLSVMEANEISDESVSKYEEDKIIILLDNYTVDSAVNIAERIIIDIRNQYSLQKDALGFPITMSFGVASYPTDGSNVRDIVNNVEKALEVAQRNGGSCCVTYEKNQQI